MPDNNSPWAQCLMWFLLLLIACQNSQIHTYSYYNTQMECSQLVIIQLVYIPAGKRMEYTHVIVQHCVFLRAFDIT